MIDFPTDRRGFLIGAGALLLAKPKLILSKVPILYGDGFHDDTEGLSALLSGRPFKSLSGDGFRPLYDDGVAYLKGGEYLILGTVTTNEEVHIRDALFRVPHDDLWLAGMMKGSICYCTMMTGEQAMGPELVHPTSGRLAAQRVRYD